MPAPYLTMADIAAVYRVSPSTARKWAAHDHWRRTGARPVRYSLADAQQSHEQRRHGRVQRHLTAKYATQEDDDHG